MRLFKIYAKKRDPLFVTASDLNEAARVSFDVWDEYSLVSEGAVTEVGVVEMRLPQTPAGLVYEPAITPTQVKR